jgi:tryptophan halogenase
MPRGDPAGRVDEMRPIQRVVVLGGGTAGLIAALTLRIKLPQLQVRVIRSADIGVIGVGEGTNAAFPQHLFEYLKVPPVRFHQLVEPTFKLGLRFLWGARAEFFYTFVVEYAGRYEGLSRPNASYVDEKTRWLSPVSALMAQDKAFARGPDGRPRFHNNYAFHVENRRLVDGLEALCRDAGVHITDGTMKAPEMGEAGVSALHLEDGERVEADLYVDASGFRSELLTRALGEPSVTFDRTLFCDRAVIGGWERTNEPIKPYTTAETMDCGWSWQIEHRDYINRGYVYASAFCSDDDARAELARKNPKIAPEATRAVRFRSGRSARCWVKNVVGIGNASGFVEPLEATAIQVICSQSRSLVGALEESRFLPGEPMRTLYNKYNCGQWDDVRDFLGIHYAFNTRAETPFWRACREETDLAGASDFAAFWREYGASGLPGGLLVSPTSTFGLEGFLALMAGQGVPVERPYVPTPAERARWHAHLEAFRAQAATGCAVSECLPF